MAKVRYKYTDMKDAPPTHREIARIAASSNGDLTYKDIAKLVNIRPNEVGDILRHKPVLDHIDKIRFLAKHRWEDLERKAREAIVDGIDALTQIINDECARPIDRLKAVDLITKITPNQPFQHKTRLEVSRGNVADGQRLNELEQRANSVRLQDLKVVDVEVLPDEKDKRKLKVFNSSDYTPKIDDGEEAAI